jgi:hypothetical protein
LADGMCLPIPALCGVKSTLRRPKRNTQTQPLQVRHFSVAGESPAWPSSEAL